MFGMGAQEIAIIAVLLLIVVGPDDLPGLLRTLGRWIGSIQSMARDFRRQIDTMADDAGLVEERKLFDQARNFNPTQMLKDTVDPTGDIEENLSETTQAAEDMSFAIRAESTLNRDVWTPPAKSSSAKTATSKEEKNQRLKRKSLNDDAGTGQ